MIGNPKRFACAKGQRPACRSSTRAWSDAVLAWLADDSKDTIEFDGNTLTITPAALTVTPNAQTKVYDATDPILPETVTSLVDTTVVGVTIVNTAAKVLTSTLTWFPSLRMSATPSRPRSGSRRGPFRACRIAASLPRGNRPASDRFPPARDDSGQFRGAVFSLTRRLAGRRLAWTARHPRPAGPRGASLARPSTTSRGQHEEHADRLRDRQPREEGRLVVPKILDEEPRDGIGRASGGPSLRRPDAAADNKPSAGPGGPGRRGPSRAGSDGPAASAGRLGDEPGPDLMTPRGRFRRERQGPRQPA